MLFVMIHALRLLFLSLSFPFVFVEGWLYSLPNELRRVVGRLCECCGLLLSTSVVFRIFPGDMGRNSSGRDQYLDSHVLFSCIAVVLFLSLAFPFVFVEGWLYALPSELRRAVGRLFECCGSLLPTSVIFRILPGGMRRNSLGRDP